MQPRKLYGEAHGRSSTMLELRERDGVQAQPVGQRCNSEKHRGVLLPVKLQSQTQRQHCKIRRTPASRSREARSATLRLLVPRHRSAAQSSTSASASASARTGDRLPVSLREKVGHRRCRLDSRSLLARRPPPLARARERARASRRATPARAAPERVRRARDAAVAYCGVPGAARVRCAAVVRERAAENRPLASSRVCSADEKCARAGS